MRRLVPSLLALVPADPMHSLRLGMRLQELHNTYQFMVLAGGSHPLMEKAAERDALVTDFFRRYLSAGK